MEGKLLRKSPTIIGEKEKNMGVYGFTFQSLYHLEVDELWDIARLIKGENHYLPRNKDVLIRGVILPFLKESGNIPFQASKDQIMRSSLIKVAQALSIESLNLNAMDTAWLVRQIRQKWSETFRKRLENLNDDELKSILKHADEKIKKRGQQMGISFIPAVGVMAGELSGFGIYLATTTGLASVSSAIGITFPWAVYQGATTILGGMLGPIGWTMAGAGVIAGSIGYLNLLFKKNEDKLIPVVVAIILKIGENPYEYFGLKETDSFAEVKKIYHAMMKTFHPDLLQEHMPEWVKHQFNELLLKTQENFEKIEKRQSEETS